MAKRELIDRTQLKDDFINSNLYTTEKGFFCYTVDEIRNAPVITEEEIVKPYLEKLKEKIYDITDTITLDADNIWKSKLYVRYADVMNIIENLLLLTEKVGEEDGKA